MPNDTAAITIVSGLPRSGTSLMMQMLEAGGIPPLTDHIRAHDDDNPRGYYELEAVKRTKRDQSWLDEAPGRAVKVIHALLYDLPGDRAYRIIFMQRNLAEVVRSQAVMLERRGTTGANLTAEQLVRAYQQQLDKVQGWMAQQPDIQVHMVDYNALVADPAPVVDVVIGFLGVSLDREAMLAVVDPSLYRQRK